MTDVVFYFQCHQPYRLRHYRWLDVGVSDDYFDDGINEMIVRRVAERCYLPMNALLLEAIRSTKGAFQCSFSLSGTVLSQLEAWAPKALDSFVELAETGHVEILCETSMHSLAFLDAPEEWEAQVRNHRDRIEALFGRRPFAGSARGFGLPASSTQSLTNGVLPCIGETDSRW